MSNVLHCLDKVKPIYKEFPGWNQSVANTRSFPDLPKEAKEYIQYLSDSLKTNIEIISVGPKRDQILIK